MKSKKPFFVLAPMDDVTDTVFRRVVDDCAPADYYVTEFVNVDGLCSAGRERILPKLSVAQDKGTVIAQIWGKKPGNFRTIASEIADGTIPGYSAVDINFGCPDKAVVKNECCSAMQQPHLREQAGELIQATLDGLDGRLPLTLKTRLGFKEIDYTWHEFLLSFRPMMLTVHVRTTKQMSKVPAQWEAILPIVELRNKISPDTKIVLNGDIANRKQGEELAKKYGVDGIMIGRGIFHNPFAFSKDSPWKKMSKEERVELFKKHLKLFGDTYKNGERKFNPLKKFAKIYISDFPGASELRDKVMHTNSIEEALSVINT